MGNGNAKVDNTKYYVSYNNVNEDSKSIVKPNLNNYAVPIGYFTINLLWKVKPYLPCIITNPSFKNLLDLSWKIVVTIL